MFGSWTQGTTLLVKEPQNVASAGKWFYVLGKETSFRAYWIVTCKSAVLTHTQHEINMKRWGFLSLCNWKPWEGDWKWSYNYRKSPTTVSLIGCEESPSVWLPKYTYIMDINTRVWACYTTLWSHMFTHILSSSAISAFYVYIATRKTGREGSGNKARTVVIT